MQCSTFGIGKAYLHTLGLQGHAHARHCATRPHGTDKAVNLAASLLPNLGTRGFDMGGAVGQIVELVGPNRPVGFGARQRLGQAARIAHVIVGVFIGHSRNLHQFRARQTDHVFLFLGLGFGNDDDGAKAHACPHQSQANPRIARRPFDNRAARFQ